MRWAVALPCLAVLAWLFAAAIRIGSVDARVYEASREIGTWMASSPAATPRAWSSVRDELAAAREVLPSNPAINELLGVLHARRVGEPESLALAMGYFLRALEDRPTSPYTWANLLEVQYLLGVTGREFESAIVRAAGLGPAEPEVQRAVALYGLAVWDEVAPATRAAIERMVAAGMRRNPAEILPISARRGRLFLACRHFSAVPQRNDPQWSKLCQGREATP